MSENTTRSRGEMVPFMLNGAEVLADPTWNLLEAIKFYGIDIPTLCYDEGLSPYGACRLCLVEVGSGDSTKLVASCVHPVKEGLEVHTHTKRVIKARKMILELLIARCPSSKKLQDMAALFELNEVRFKPLNYDCILCGLCVRMCEEQMGAKAIGFTGRGTKRYITTPFDMTSEECRKCGACMYICPVCELRCQGPQADTTLCSGCINTEPICVEEYDEAMCYMVPCLSCMKGPEDVNKNNK
ncbi:coenzyme F420 hydrogenase subunit beta [Candidatus Methanomarinus sp.]|nr:coenzyme F420 hydrogenase subunit beta [ANME-2 cluster archaeon]